jgi:hypothetical protein
MFEDTKWAIKSRKSKKDRQYNDHNKKGLSMIHETLHWKLKIEQQEPPLPLLGVCSKYAWNKSNT